MPELPVMETNMAITITTLNDGTSNINHALSSVGADLKQHDWRDTTSVTNGRYGLLTIKQTNLPASPLGKPVRRTLVQLKSSLPVATTVSGTSKNINEEVVVNFTITAPQGLSSNFPANELRDLVGQLKSFLTDANLLAIAAGEL